MSDEPTYIDWLTTINTGRIQQNEKEVPALLKFS